MITRDQQPSLIFRFRVQSSTKILGMEKYPRSIIVKFANVVESDQKAPFSVATTQRCRGGCYFFPWITPLYS